MTFSRLPQAGPYGPKRRAQARISSAKKRRLSLIYKDDEEAVAALKKLIAEKAMSKPGRNWRGLYRRQIAQEQRPVGVIAPIGLNSPGKFDPHAIRGTAFQPDNRARAILRFAAIAERTLEQCGGAYSLDEAISLLRITKQAIGKRVAEGTLLSVPGPHSARVYPTAQFQSDGSVVAGIKPVRDALPIENAWTVLNFFVSPDDYLNGRSPLEILREGRVEDAIEAAKRFGEQGA